MDDFKLALTVVMDNGETYTYYTDEEESDDNACTKMFINGKIASDNIFATNSLKETLYKICNKEIVNYSMSKSMEYTYVCMIEDGEFDS